MNGEVKVYIPRILVSLCVSSKREQGRKEGGKKRGRKEERGKKGGQERGRKEKRGRKDVHSCLCPH